MKANQQRAIFHFLNDTISLILNHFHVFCSYFLIPEGKDVSVILGGDFNSLPVRGLYEYLTKGKYGKTFNDWYSCGIAEYPGMVSGRSKDNHDGKTCLFVHNRIYNSVADYKSSSVLDVGCPLFFFLSTTELKIPLRTIVLQAWVSSVVSPILNMGFFPKA